MVRPGAGCPWGRGGGGEFPWEFSSATLALCPPPPPPACLPAPARTGTCSKGCLLHLQRMGRSCGCFGGMQKHTTGCEVRAWSAHSVCMGCAQRTHDGCACCMHGVCACCMHGVHTVHAPRAPGLLLAAPSCAEGSLTACPPGAGPPRSRLEPMDTIFVKNVREDSPAHQAGLRTGEQHAEVAEV